MIKKFIILLSLSSLLLRTISADEILIKKLISNLSSENYEERESSTEKLKNIGRPVLVFIKQEIVTSSDLEVILRCESIYLHYYYVVDKNGCIPNIWLLDNNLRFPKGFKIEYSKDRSLCKIESVKDIAVEYYVRTKLMIDIKDAISGSIPYSIGKVTNWQSEIIGRLAMRMYITDVLYNEQTKDLAQKIIDKSSNNAIAYRNYYQTSDIKGLLWDWWKYPPGPIVLRSDYKDPWR